ncbi:Transmembrane protein [Chlorella sorokiniana]|uniref:Transmembrane protein n=1 Tax=Chlorella sorokiniana TaxID=3076 RepID=A0A2P6TNP4_CHLSO|nr:Transmembrane protein [Chlorella sorokiniana]|eukprot:PRW50944.1 Transmembrane protein [Chlorella sorokiniana]
MSGEIQPSASGAEPYAAPPPAQPAEQDAEGSSSALSAVQDAVGTAAAAAGAAADAAAATARQGAVAAAAAAVAAAVKSGGEAAMANAARGALVLNMDGFAREVVEKLVNNGDAAAAGRLCVAAIQMGPEQADAVRHIAVQLIASGSAATAATLGAAFWREAAAAGSTEAAAPAGPAQHTSGELQAAAAVVFAAAAVEAVGQGHAATMVEVTQLLLDDGQQELVAALVATMVAAGHSKEAGTVSLEALAQGRHRVVEAISAELLQENEGAALGTLLLETTTQGLQRLSTKARQAFGSWLSPSAPLARGPMQRPEQPVSMLLRWLLISLYALGMLVVRTRGVCDQQCEDEASPRSGRRQRDRAPAGSPRTTRREPLRRSLGSDPRLAMLSGVIVSVITLLATARWTPGFGRMFTLSGFLNISSMMAVPLMGLVLVPALAPAFYQRHSTALIAVMRIFYFALPALRDPLDVQHVFQSQPSQRVLGFVTDSFTLMLGALCAGGS